MGKIISKIDTTLRIPANFKNLTGKEPLVIELKAEEPTEVPENILNHYTKHRPHVFRRSGEPAPEAPKGGDINDLPKEFDPVGFITENYDSIEAGINTLEDPQRPKLFKLSATLRLSGYHTQSNERIKERIIADIKAKRQQEEKLNNNT